MWSLGCILSELYTGNPLFPGLNELEQINFIMKSLGPPPLSLIESSPEKKIFFSKNKNKNYSDYINVNPYDISKKKENISQCLKTNNYNTLLKNDEKIEFDNFIDFICRCLEWNPKDRINPEDALMHPFIVNDFNYEQMHKHKLKIKRMKKKICNGFLTSREKEKDLSSRSKLRGNNNIIINNKDFIKKNMSSEIYSLKSSFNKITKDEFHKYLNNNKNDNMKSSLDYENKNNEQRKNNSFNNFTHFSTKKDALSKRKKIMNENLMLTLSNIDFKLRKIIKFKNIGKYLNKNINKDEISHILYKKKSKICVKKVNK